MSCNEFLKDNKVQGKKKNPGWYSCNFTKLKGSAQMEGSYSKQVLCVFGISYVNHNNGVYWEHITTKHPLSQFY